MKRIFFLFLFFILSSCNHVYYFSSKVHFSEEDKQKITQAKKYNDSRDYEKALDIYQELNKKHKNSRYIIIKMADCYRMLGNCSKAKTYYRKLLKDQDLIDNPESEASLAIFEGIGLCMIYEGKYKKAIDTLSYIFEMDASRWKVVNALGVAYALDNNSEEAEEYFKIALNLGEKEYIVYNNMALAYALNYNYEKALQAQKKSIAFAKENADREKLDFNLALIYGIKGDLGSAEAVLLKYLPKEQAEANLLYYDSLRKNKEASRKKITKSLGVKTDN